MNENAVIGAVTEITGRGLIVPQDFSVVSIVSSPLVAVTRYEAIGDASRQCHVRVPSAFGVFDTSVPLPSTSRDPATVTFKS